MPAGAELATYADDTTLYQCISATASISDSAAQLQEAVDAVSHWGSKWKVTFEPSKSQALIIDHRKSPPAVPPVLFNGVTVPEEKEIKLLGIAFDSQLSYAAHLRAVASKAAQRLHFLRKVCAPVGLQRPHGSLQRLRAANNGILLPGVDGVRYIQTGQNPAQGTEGDRPRRLAPQPETPPTGCCAFVHVQAVLPSNNKPPEAHPPTSSQSPPSGWSIH